LVQKAFYLGVGAASYAAEKAGTTLADLRVQAQKLADEMVARGEMTAEDAKRMVDDMVSRAQQSDPENPAQPRRIEILVEDEPAPESGSSPEPPPASPSASTSPASTSPASASPTPPAQPASAVDDLRQQVVKLQEELRRLRQD
jgi:polyhydroxyalkanoate synthesis regulator phasin